MTKYNFYLTKVEKLVLYKKYKSKGLTSDEVNDKLKHFVNHLSKLVKKLREKNKSDDQINIKFREEFEKMCQRLECE